MTFKIFRNTALAMAFILLNTAVSCIREDDSPVKLPPIKGAILSPEVGGATEPNQVWIDLSEGSMKTSRRDAWDQGFYCGKDFRVILNSSVMMAAGKIENATDIDAVTPKLTEELQEKVQVANFEPNAQYIDDPAGNYLTQTTGIAAIKVNDGENPVYLINIGHRLYNGPTSPGSVYTMGDSRGFMKIRVLRYGDGYKIQYAQLQDKTHKEILVTKNSDYHFKFLNLENGSFGNVQPEKKKWDLCYTVFTNLTNNPANNMLTSYVFSDSVLGNLLSGVYAYHVKTAPGKAEQEYNAFKKEDIKASEFVSNDQRVIGSNWRTTTGPNGAEVFTDRFYILKDADGFYFKIRFLRMKNSEEYRGFPQFEYQPL